MNSSAPTCLVDIQQHWQKHCTSGLNGFDWLGAPIKGDWLAEQVQKQRQILATILECSPNSYNQIVGIAIADGIENLVLGLALALEGITQTILPITATSTEQILLSRRFKLTHLIGVAGPPDRECWQPVGSALGLGCWRKVNTVEYELDGSSYPDGTCGQHEDGGRDLGPLIFLGTTSGTTTGRPGLTKIHSRTLRDIVLSKRWSPYDLVRKPLFGPDMQNWSSRTSKLRQLLQGRSFVTRPSLTPLASNPLPTDCDGTLMAPGGLRRRLAQGDLLHCSPDFLIISGSDHVPMELRRTVAAIDGISLGITYATSQTGPLTWLPPEALLDETDSVGWLLPDVTLKSVDSGSILERENLSFREALITKSHKSLNPGDLLAISASGQVIFGGRANDVFLFNSVLISPLEIEDVLMQHPGINECAAFGATSARFGSVPMAAITARPQWPSEKILQELEALCRESLGIRRPRKLIIMDTIPKGNTGKALRRELSRMHALQQ